MDTNQWMWIIWVREFVALICLYYQCICESWGNCIYREGYVLLDGCWLDCSLHSIIKLKCQNNMWFSKTHKNCVTSLCQITQVQVQVHLLAINSAYIFNSDIQCNIFMIQWCWRNVWWYDCRCHARSCKMTVFLWHQLWLACWGRGWDGWVYIQYCNFGSHLINYNMWKP